jgi:hypothetical protein
MKFLRAKPRRIPASLCLAMVFSILAGSLVYLLVFGLPADPGRSFGDRALDFAALLVPVTLACAVVGALYAYPALLLLDRFDRAGPASVLLLALAPAMVLALVPDLRPLALILASYGALAGGAFAVLAYRSGDR